MYLNHMNKIKKIINRCQYKIKMKFNINKKKSFWMNKNKITKIRPVKFFKIQTLT